jgi:hypothetical protein
MVRTKPFEEDLLEYENWFHNLREIRDIERIRKGCGEVSSCSFASLGYGLLHHHGDYTSAVRCFSMLIA